MDKKDTDQKLRWHPAFLQAIQQELYDYKDALEFKDEYQLTAAPLHIDLLIIKKPKELVINKNIARIFRTDNLLEYKSPEDYLSVKDFWKVYAYAHLYAAITPGVELSDITLTFAGNRQPRKLLEYLTGTRGYRVEESAPGIYQVTGDYLPIQIIESKKLPLNENLWLKSLTNDLETRNLSAILRQGEKKSLDAYMDVILRANQKALTEVYGMEFEVYDKIFKDAGIVPKWVEDGRVLGREQGKEEVARNLLARSMPIEDIAQVTELPVEKIRSLVPIN